MKLVPYTYPSWSYSNLHNATDLLHLTNSSPMHRLFRFCIRWGARSTNQRRVDGPPSECCYYSDVHPDNPDSPRLFYFYCITNENGVRVMFSQVYVCLSVHRRVPMLPITHDALDLTVLISPPPPSPAHPNVGPVDPLGMRVCPLLVTSGGHYWRKQYAIFHVI